MNQLMMSMTTSIMFTQTKHPMAIGLMLLTQTTLTCMISGTMYKRFWFSYILFMIIIGGMLVLFTYMTSIASNEMFSSPNKMIIIVTMMTPFISMMTDSTSNKEMTNHNTMTENEVMVSTTLMYEQTTGTLTTMLVMYMLLTLIVLVKMININWGPLWQTK